MELLRSPLHERHVALGAKLADFGGWQMPIEYASSGGGVLKEHAAVRESVGVFDVSHFGKAAVRGAGARAFVNNCLSNDLGRIQLGQAQYTLCCDESGGVVDDLIAYLVSDDEVFLVPNAANTAEVVRRLAAAAPAGVEVTDLHRDFGVLAVQGPRSADVLDRLGLPSALDYMSYADAMWDGRPVRICRTGYTGEHGYELLPRWDDALPLWDALVAVLPDLRWPARRPRARGTRCVPKWDIPCTGRICRSTSRRCRPDRAGRWAGRRTRSGAARRCWRRRPAALAACCVASSRSTAESRAPICRCCRRPARRSAR